ncbi:ABC transporter ATP-binding protein [Mesorhizobium sp. B2-8-3]|nr:ABC transporter ATP-binding protein [Mesorhizobium sp. B2-8-3]
MSGGQARRVAIARALFMKPSILIADEPTAGLDVSVQGDLLNLLQDIRRVQNITLVVISHNLAVVRLIAENAVVMRAGRVVDIGEAASLFQSPRDAYTRELLAAWPSVHPLGRSG